MIKTSKQLERHFKGIANHHRINILILVQSLPGITLDDIASKLQRNFKTISEHTIKLTRAGLLNKKYRGHKVEHYLSPYGQKMIKLINTF